MRPPDSKGRGGHNAAVLREREGRFLCVELWASDCNVTRPARAVSTPPQGPVPAREPSPGSTTPPFTAHSFRTPHPCSMPRVLLVISLSTLPHPEAAGQPELFETAVLQTPVTALTSGFIAAPGEGRGEAAVGWKFWGCVGQLQGWHSVQGNQQLALILKGQLVPSIRP